MSAQALTQVLGIAYPTRSGGVIERAGRSRARCRHRRCDLDSALRLGGSTSTFFFRCCSPTACTSTHARFRFPFHLLQTSTNDCRPANARQRDLPRSRHSQSRIFSGGSHWLETRPVCRGRSGARVESNHRRSGLARSVYIDPRKPTACGGRPFARRGHEPAGRGGVASRFSSRSSFPRITGQSTERC